MILVYAIGVALLLCSALPTIGQCIVEMFDPDESDWNRHGAFWWIMLIIAVCFLWPLVLVLILVTWVFGREKSKADS